jgi:hypothetical protein
VNEQGKPAGITTVFGGFFGPFLIIVFLISGFFSLLASPTFGSTTLRYGMLPLFE